MLSNCEHKYSESEWNGMECTQRIKIKMDTKSINRVCNILGVFYSLSPCYFFWKWRVSIRWWMFFFIEYIIWKSYVNQNFLIHFENSNQKYLSGFELRSEMLDLFAAIVNSSLVDNFSKSTKAKYHTIHKKSVFSGRNYFVETAVKFQNKNNKKLYLCTKHPQNSIFSAIFSLQSEPCPC